MSVADALESSMNGFNPSAEGHEAAYYHYAALDGDCIRVLRVSAAAQFDDEVCGELVPISLTAGGGPPPYNALSYSWGPTSANGLHLDEFILCGGQKLRITSTLKTALRHIRAYGYHGAAPVFTDDFAVSATDIEPYRHLAFRPLWVDAVCINQADPLERARQVEMMASIYRYSMNVIVWLGSAEGLPLAAHSTPPNTPNSERRRSTGDKLKFWRRSNKTPTPPHTAPPDIGAVALDWIVERPWFRRRWVLQEMLYARECDILIGDFVCSRPRIRKMLSDHYMSDRALPLFLHDTDPIALGLLKACWRYDTAACSDPRDRIFALKHMSHEGSQFEADYSLNARDAYYRALLATVLAPELCRGGNHLPAPSGPIDLRHAKQYGLLQMLAIASCKNSSPDASECPEIEAWLPDWRQPTLYRSKAHERAVSLLVSRLDSTEGFETAHWSLPEALEHSDSGYGYLKIRTRLITRTNLAGRPSRGTSPVFPPSKMLARLPEPERERDCIWVPCIDPEMLMVGFVLRPGRTRALYHEKPVFRLDSCFVFRGYRLHLDPDAGDPEWISEKALYNPRSFNPPYTDFYIE